MCVCRVQASCRLFDEHVPVEKAEWRALRPPGVVFVLGFVSLINSLTSGKIFYFSGQVGATRSCVSTYASAVSRLVTW